MGTLNIALHYGKGQTEPTQINLASISSSQPGSATCVAKAKSGQRCTRAIGKDARGRIANDVARLLSASPVEGLPDMLQDLAKRLLCSAHQEEEPAILAALTKAVEQDGRAKTCVPSKISARASTKHVEHSARHFVQYRHRPRSKEASQTLVENIKGRPHTRSEDRSGYIYIWEDPIKAGFFKIGLAQDVPTRLKQRSSRCKRDVTVVEDPHQRRIRHVRRAEAIIHAELGLYQMEEKDCPCGSDHHEWFAVEKDKALKAIEGARDYIDLTYGPVKEEGGMDIDTAPSPLKRPMAAKKPRSGSKGTIDCSCVVAASPSAVQVSIKVSFDVRNDGVAVGSRSSRAR
jgi:hypothetical protein